MSGPPCVLLPNLGAEEGDDWRAYRSEPAARVAARLWTHLFAGESVLRTPDRAAATRLEDFSARRTDALWPESLGEPPDHAAYEWLETPGGLVPWLSTAAVASIADAEPELEPTTPAPGIVARVHDKGFAAEAARELGLVPRALAPLVTVVDAEACREPDALIASLERKLAQWPEWTGARFTLKPRSGSSGRGRVAGQGRVDGPALRGALGRMASRGGAVFEPWLERSADLSVCVRIPGSAETDGLPLLLGSLEMLTTPGGGVRGHCGEIDSRGRVFSGHRQDEALREAAGLLAGRAREAGYFGPCGLDGLVYREGERDRLRPVVELNARPTMGLVALGLLRRVLPRVRERLELTPGARRGFLLALLPRAIPGLAERMARAAGAIGEPLSLARVDEDEGPIPCLFFAEELEPLRAAYASHVASAPRPAEDPEAAPEHDAGLLR